MVSVPRPPTRSEGIHSPLQRRGWGWGCLIWVLEDGARRPPSYFDLTRLSQEVFVLLASLFTLHITTPPPYYGLQDYSLPSPTGRGKPPNGGAEEGLVIWVLEDALPPLFLVKYINNVSLFSSMPFTFLSTHQRSERQHNETETP